MADLSKTIYQFRARLITGKDKNLSDYKNKVLLVVNIASACGFVGQLKELEALREEFKDQGFEVLGFPSNDFGRQEPLDNPEINTFCIENYAVHFPLFEKIMVRGEYANPIFKFLGKTSTPRWNFHKYLINKEGEVVDYFFPFTTPLSSKVKKKIQKLLK